MRNFPLKMTALLKRFEPNCSPKLFLDSTPAKAFHDLYQRLPLSVQQRLTFSFSSNSLISIIDQEFEVPMEGGLLVFRKPFLDAQSFRLVYEEMSDPEITEKTDLSLTEWQYYLDSCASWLFESTRTLYRPNLDIRQAQDIHQEYLVVIQGYLKFYPQVLKQLYAEQKAIGRECWRQFMYRLTADTLYKTDGAKALFGDESAYAKAWERKEFQRYRMCRVIEQNILDPKRIVSFGEMG